MCRTISLLLGAMFLLSCDKQGRVGAESTTGPAGPFRFGTPSMSGDGRTVAYDTDSTGSGDIYLYNRERSSSTPITRGPAIDASPIISFDGSRIAFARKTNGYQHIWLLNTVNSNSTAIQLTHGNVVDAPVRFSTNNTDVYFIRRSLRQPRAIPENELLVASNASESAVQIVALGQLSAITADGRIAVRESYDRTLHCYKLFRVVRESGREEYVGCGYLSSISDDGESVTYITADASYMQHIVLWRLNRNTEMIRRIPVGNKSRADFCLGDEAIIFRVFDSERDGPGGAYLLHLNDRKVEKLDGIEGGSIR